MFIAQVGETTLYDLQMWACHTHLSQPTEHATPRLTVMQMISVLLH